MMIAEFYFPSRLEKPPLYYQQYCNNINKKMSKQINKFYNSKYIYNFNTTNFYRASYVLRIFIKESVSRDFRRFFIDRTAQDSSQ